MTSEERNRTGRKKPGTGRKHNRADLSDRWLALAQEHAEAVRAPASRPADPGLKSLKQRFGRIYARIAESTRPGQTGSRPEEWLLDNRHIVEQSLEEVRKDLPAAYLRQLPRLTARDDRPPGNIRVRALSQALLADEIKPLDLPSIEQAVDRYQLKTVLTIGELWALPAMLRLTILVNLADNAEESLDRVEALRAVDTGVDTVLEDVPAEHVAGDIISLRHLDAHDWRRSFEYLSRVDRVLRRDPAKAYALMDFETRNRYRDAVESLARGTGRSEMTVVEQAVELCRHSDPGRHRMRHVGYFLVSEGRPALESALGHRLSPFRRVTRLLLGRPGLVYFLLLGIMTMVPLVALGFFLWREDAGTAAAALVLALATVPVAGLAVAMLNGLIAWLLAPRVLPKLSFEKGIPPEHRTVVVMPVIFGGPEDVDHVAEHIEVNYLNNEDDSLVYAILSDWSDAPEEKMPTDGAVLDRAVSAVRRLNKRYGRGPERGPFLLLHRSRLWNDAEGCWMGWERKRGKLAELNRLLAGSDATTYATRIGDPGALSGVRFVLTLDADTLMPAGAARRLVGAMAHPLNRAVIDEKAGRLEAGYSILQPRLEIDPDSTQDTRFTEVFAGDTTMDLYTHATSDVYYDLFGEGIYAGKGLYDWRAFEHVLVERIPENALLSHDLLEGIHGRTALVSDVVLLEQYPENALAYMRRLHRWVRGDWQLLPWLAPLVPSAVGRWFRNPLPAIHRWKIVDNLRRSIQPPVVLALLLVAWLGVIPGPPWLWTILFAGLLAAPLVAELFNILGRGLARPATLRQRLREAPHALWDRLEHWLLLLVLLPFESYMVLDAVGRTLFRLLVTRRRLLEWTSAAHTQRRLGSGGSRRSRIWREMWISPVTAAGCALAIQEADPLTWYAAMPLLLAWLVAPQIVWWVNRPLYEPPPPIPRDERAYLRRVARRTWLFFEQFTGPDNHWLPPDNYQEEPRTVLARRTSPTNIGMALVSTTAAWDLGYIDASSLAARIRNTFEGMSGLERFRGHWLNWYETRELHPLLPRYVSTVDSGNLAACLVVLARGMEDIAAAPVQHPNVYRGMADTVSVLAETLEESQRESGNAPAPLLSQLHAIRRRLLRARTPAERWQSIAGIEEDFAALSGELLDRVERGELVLAREQLSQLRTWLDELGRELRQARRLMESLQPWLPAFAEPPAAWVEAREDSLIARRFRDLRKLLNREIPLRDLPDRCRAAGALLDELAKARDGVDGDGARAAAKWTDSLAGSLETAAADAKYLLTELDELAGIADRWVDEMEFGFLYDENRNLFRIGYNVTTGSPDPNYYDLLASEARLSGFMAIAKGDVPGKHWLHLDRPFRRIGKSVVLMSWGATLFEYLMPHLFMNAPPDSMMSKACRTAISMHRDFTRRWGLPWGISESGYYQLDDEQHYQYRAFGVPGLGFRRNLGDRLVVAPYASIMALGFDPSGVMKNLVGLESFRGRGLYGFYEAVDFGRVEKSVPRRARVVRSYMSHHQGMALAAIDNFLSREAMARRFHADRRVTRVSMLLHERLPRDPPIPRLLGLPDLSRHFAPRPNVSVQPIIADERVPRHRHVLSNGHYSLLLDTAGGGASQWDGIALTRWSFDPTCDDAGHWVYVKDLDEGALLSIGRDPVGSEAGECTVQAGPHVMQYQRRGRSLFCQMNVALSSQHDVEVRRISIRNESGRRRRILVANYAELALCPPREFLRHPAFARLFVESECLENESMLIYRRRPRSAAEKPLYLAHTMLAQPGNDYRFGWETDRRLFLGRGGCPARPAILDRGLDSFSGSTGAVLDPVIGSGAEVELQPFGTFEMAYLTGVGRSRSELLAIIRSYRSMPRANWIFEQARMQSEQELQNLRMEPAQVPLAMAVLSAVLSPRGAMRPASDGPYTPRALQSVLWSRGISGDQPLILVSVRDKSDISFVEEVIKLHTFLCARLVAVDLLLIDEESSGYAQPTRDRLEQAISNIRSRTHRRLTGSVFVIAGKELAADTRAGLLAASLLVLDTAEGSIGGQVVRGTEAPAELPPFVPVKSAAWQALPLPPLFRPDDLLHDNGLGGFSSDGAEYVIHLEPGVTTPAPWTNVLANPGFGTLVTESGSSCTWYGNSSEQRLTPWPNDPVGDMGGEAIYIRDEETGRVWTPTPAPMPDGNAYQVRHGAGYTEYLHHSPGLSERYRVHVDGDAPVKLCRLALTNHAAWTRRVTVTCYAEWVLGTVRADTVAHVRTAFDPETGALLARNVFDRLAGTTVAFLAASRTLHGVTADRAEFLGTDGDVRAPAALYRIGLSGEVGQCDDPCAACQVHVDLPPGETQVVHFVLGQGADRREAVALARRFRDPEEAEASFERVRVHWEQLLGAVEVETPDPAMDLLLNRWLLYQVLASRLWGRTGYYQSSGAYGYRDQLQDVLSLTWAAPALAREHILRAAARQFQEGDVVHWWHEAPLRGVRTRCSDDLLWLPFVTSHYVLATGDESILKERVPYLCGPKLGIGEMEHYSELTHGKERGSLYEHCGRAIDHAAATGQHGLPLIGGGDWNDGFNRIGASGSGESVWLAWFLIRVCRDFAPLCERRGDESLANHYRQLADELLRSVEQAGWDGNWYRRAYYDDGTPVGAGENDECRIDLIAQAWSVMSAAEPSERARTAMDSAWERLVNPEERLILLLAPPFDKGARDPGYIKGYPPGIRENGGQYTHAATWAVWAAVGLKDAERAMESFRLLNPILRTASPEDVARYRVEPYVLPGDVYGVPPHTGRGGWTWYSGAAAWLYRAGVEAILGLKRLGDEVEIEPCLPPDWPGYRARLRCGRANYKLDVRCNHGIMRGGIRVVLDDNPLQGRRFPFVDDGRDHRVDVELVPAGAAAERQQDSG